MQPRLTVIGIHVREDPAGLHRTVEALDQTTTVSHRILLLGDGADGRTTAAMNACRLPQSSTRAVLGAPACFNRLTQSKDADVFVLIESGCVPAHGWLGMLLEAFDADPRNMLAGPSTNLSWNDQAKCPTNASALARIGEYRTLEPLYSLADFCYAVKREVVETIGGADERYGPGPCWEMDYNIRAARAGFRGVWVCGSFVYRHGIPQRRQRAEVELFERSKRLYQDKFCGLRRGGVDHPYEPHCRGDECEHFAPAELIRVEPARTPDKKAAHRSEPLLSCVMVTRGRPDYVAQSIRYFERQTWKNRELIIVYDEETDLPRDLAAIAATGVRTFRLPGSRAIGTKRNYGCEQARGEIVAQWDDDDWYGPDRLCAQADPIVNGGADITGLRTPLFFEIDPWRFWTCSDALHARIFMRDVHGGTLVYKRTVWKGGVRYPNVSLAEDAMFLDRAARRGARLERIQMPGLFVYLRHATNSWKFQCGEFTEARSWTTAAEPDYLKDDREFYLARTRQAAKAQAKTPTLQEQVK